jgi:hypothetical protein
MNLKTVGEELSEGKKAWHQPHLINLNIENTSSGENAFVEAETSVGNQS